MTKFALVNPEVLRLRASQGDGEAEPHIDWQISYAPEPVKATHEVADGPTRVFYPVIGSLHVGGPSGWGDISVGGLLVVTVDPAEINLDLDLAPSEAVETLYDIARGHLAPLLRTIDCVEELPRRSPDVTATEFAPDEDDADSDQAVTSAS